MPDFPIPGLPPPSPRAHRVGRILELAILFGFIPGVLAARWVSLPLMPLLWTVCLYCLWRLRQGGHSGLALGRKPGMARGEWRRMLLTFVLVSGLLVAAVWAVRPEALFALPRHHPWRWFLILVLYPPLSVLPQEVVYRAFFFNRYQFLFGSGTPLLVAGALAFGMNHLVFHNWVAVALTVPGGLLFARSYHRNGKLLYVVCEHALYGCMIFTIGLGDFLAQGAPRLYQ